MPTISLDTVYKTLWLLNDLSLVGTLGAPREGTRFDANLSPHHHFVCVRCGLTLDFYSDELDELKLPQVCQLLWADRDDTGGSKRHLPAWQRNEQSQKQAFDSKENKAATIAARRKVMPESKGSEKASPARWKCRNCGYVHEGPEAPDKCPACLHPQEHFEIKETTY
jgi:hypothetical protein